MQNIR